MLLTQTSTGQARNCKFLKAVLAYELSSNHEASHNSATTVRQQSVLEAERRFYKRYGTIEDRLLRRFRLLRALAGR